MMTFEPSDPDYVNDLLTYRKQVMELLEDFEAAVEVAYDDMHNPTQVQIAEPERIKDLIEKILEDADCEIDVNCALVMHRESQVHDLVKLLSEKDSAMRNILGQLRKDNDEPIVQGMLKDAIALQRSTELFGELEQ